MQVARLRPNSPLGGAQLTCEDGGTRFFLEGAGEITAAKLLDLENRRQLDWGIDDASRVRLLRAAAGRARADAAAQVAARAAAARRAATSAAERGDGGAHGIPAVATRFAAPADDLHRGGRVAWREASAVAPPARPATTPSRARAGRGRARAVLVALAVCLALIALVAAFPRQTAHQLALSFTREVTPSTELYFSDAGSLPTSLSLRHPNRFAFAIVNHEGHDRVYSYVVTVTGPGESAVVARGRVELKAGAAVGRSVVFAPAEPGGVYLVSVRLAMPAQSIFFRGYS